MPITAFSTLMNSIRLTLKKYSKNSEQNVPFSPASWLTVGSRHIKRQALGKGFVCLSKTHMAISTFFTYQLLSIYKEKIFVAFVHKSDIRVAKFIVFCNNFDILSLGIVP